MFSRWVGAGAVQEGKRQNEDGKPCQNSVAVKSGNGVLSAALADGAKSAENSHLGSSKAVEIATDYLIEEFDSLAELDSADIANQLSEALDAALIDYADEESVDPESLSSTLLFIGIKAGTVLFGRLGGGIILGTKNGETQFVSLSETDQYVEKGHLTMRKDWGEHLKIYSRDASSLDAVILMSESAGESLYFTEADVPPPAVKLADWYHNIRSSKMEQVIKHNLAETISENTSDDAALTIAQRKTHSYIELEYMPLAYVKEYLGVQRRDAVNNTLELLKHWERGMSVPDVAEKMGLSDSTVYRHIHRLEALGFFRRQSDA
jgi:Mor family transcriptional regulator